MCRSDWTSGLCRLGAVLTLGGVLASGCTAGQAFRQGETAALNGDWDAAVEYYQRAMQEDPDRPEYRIALERAMVTAGRVHFAAAQELESRDDLTGALLEYRRASELDASNGMAAVKVGALERAIRDLVEAARPPPPIEALRAQARLETQPPLLNPASREPLRLAFTDASLRDIMDALGDASGINVTYDEQFQDRSYTVELGGVTFEEALDQILLANSFFYKVVNDTTIIIVPDTPQKRAAYEEQVIRTFFVSHATVEELVQLLTTIVRVPQMAVQPQFVANAQANTITVRATTAVAGVIEKVIAANDKPRAEVIIDVEILEVNRERAKQFGLDLTQYALGAVFSPELAPPNESTTPSGVSSPPPFNLNTISQGVSTADFYMSVPAAVVRFLETDTHTTLIAKPQLRGQEGTELTLNLGEEIPVPSTAFTPLAAGGAAFNPLTSFNYRPVGVNVVMTPRVTYENEIVLDLDVENSTVGPSINVAGQLLPTFGTRRVVTRLRLRDGESNLLAGLLREEDRTLLRGFPGILNLPIIKQLFSANEESVQQTDIVMLLTPRIVRTHEITQEDLSPIHIGTQRNIGLTGPPPLIAPVPDAGAPDAAAPVPEPPLDAETLEPDAAAADVEPETPAAVDAPTEPATEPDAVVDDVRDLLTEPADTPEFPEPPQPRPVVGTQVLITPPGQEFTVGAGPYTVPISVTGASQLSTLTLSVAYNPSVLRVSTVQEGSFLRQGGTDVAFTQQVDAINGRIDLTLSRINDPTGASGAGLLAAILFEPIAPGTAQLSLSGIGLTPGGAAVALDLGTATVTAR